MEKKSLPVFRYHPDPMATGSLAEGEPVTCLCCGEQTSVWYKGPFYAIESVRTFCPWCIASGKAHEKYDGEFQDPSCCEQSASAEAVDEVCHRTPGYAAWQQENWLGHCGDLCAFMGCFTWEELRENEGAMQALREAGAERDFDMDSLEQSIRGGGVIPCVFQCLHCGRYLIDLNID